MAGASRRSMRETRRSFGPRSTWGVIEPESVSSASGSLSPSIAVAVHDAATSAIEGHLREQAKKSGHLEHLIAMHDPAQDVSPLLSSIDIDWEHAELREMVHVDAAVTARGSRVPTRMALTMDRQRFSGDEEAARDAFVATARGPVLPPFAVTGGPVSLEFVNGDGATSPSLNLPNPVDAGAEIGTIFADGTSHLRIEGATAVALAPGREAPRYTIAPVPGDPSRLNITVHAPVGLVVHGLTRAPGDHVLTDNAPADHVPADHAPVLRVRTRDRQRVQRVRTVPHAHVAKVHRAVASATPAVTGDLGAVALTSRSGARAPTAPFSFLIPASGEEARALIGRLAASGATSMSTTPIHEQRLLALNVSAAHAVNLRAKVVGVEGVTTEWDVSVLVRQRTGWRAEPASDSAGDGAGDSAGDSANGGKHHHNHHNHHHNHHRGGGGGDGPMTAETIALTRVTPLSTIGVTGAGGNVTREQVDAQLQFLLRLAEEKNSNRVDAI